MRIIVTSTQSVKKAEHHCICLFSNVIWYHNFSGSFVQHSNIMVRQPEYARAMEEAMTPDDHQFFGDYFRRYNEYLCAIPTQGRPVPLPDDKIHSVLEEALLSKCPYSSYTNETPRYKWYHFMFKISPAWLRDRLVKRFIKMPEF